MSKRDPLLVPTFSSTLSLYSSVMSPRLNKMNQDSSISMYFVKKSYSPPFFFFFFAGVGWVTEERAVPLPNSYMFCPFGGTSHKGDLGIMGKICTEENACQAGNCQPGNLVWEL